MLANVVHRLQAGHHYGVESTDFGGPEFLDRREREVAEEWGRSDFEVSIEALSLLLETYPKSPKRADSVGKKRAAGK